ncbi:MAG: hypothetical protein IT381_00770 [Deltaproteobacteria bacterium]|nr:hypothetical protein [Deltaproteobacteria bacterium]
MFIRAPRIVRVGASVEVLDRHRGEPVLVRQRNVTAATFHPELSADAAFFYASLPFSESAADQLMIGVGSSAPL